MKKDRPLYKMIPYIDALNLPPEVENWCADNDISTHYASEVHTINDDGNPMAEWLKSIGLEPRKRYKNSTEIIFTIAIAGT